MRRAGRLLALCLFVPSVLAAQVAADPRLDRFKDEIVRAIDARAKLGQQMVDQVFSFGELGMQEIEIGMAATLQQADRHRHARQRSAGGNALLGRE